MDKYKDSPYISKREKLNDAITKNTAKRKRSHDLNHEKNYPYQIEKNKKSISMIWISQRHGVTSSDANNFVPF